MFDGLLILWVKSSFVDHPIHPQSNKYVMGVKITASDNSIFVDSPVSIVTNLELLPIIYSVVIVFAFYQRGFSLRSLVFLPPQKPRSRCFQ